MTRKRAEIPGRKPRCQEDPHNKKYKHGVDHVPVVMNRPRTEVRLSLARTKVCVYDGLRCVSLSHTHPHSVPPRPRRGTPLSHGHALCALGCVSLARTGTEVCVSLTHSHRFSLSVYIYIYIYVCVCIDR